MYNATYQPMMETAIQAQELTVEKGRLILNGAVDHRRH
jgi:hypothetical protein